MDIYKTTILYSLLKITIFASLSEKSLETGIELKERECG